MSMKRREIGIPCNISNNTQQTTERKKQLVA